jgi:ribosomal protein L9
MLCRASFAVEDGVEMRNLNAAAFEITADAMASGSWQHEASEKERDRKVQSLETLKNYLLEASSIVLIKRVGAGAFGEVYKASYHGSVVAVKTMIEVTADAMKLFRAEVRVMRQLRQTNCLTFNLRGLRRVRIKKGLDNRVHLFHCFDFG